MKKSPSLGKLSAIKNGKKWDNCPLWATPPPKWLKSGHVLFDYVRKWDSQHFNVKWELYKGSIVLKLYPNIIRNNR